MTRDPEDAATRRRRDFAGGAAAALLGVLPLLPGLLRGLAPFGNTDTWVEGVPLRSFLIDRLSQGRLPLYTDCVFGGYAVHADPSSNWLYPPTLLCLPLGPVLGIYAELFLHYSLAGVGAYALARSHGASRATALAAAAAFGMAGPLVYWFRHYMCVFTAAWFPLQLLALRLVLLEGGVRRALLFGAAWACSFLGGEVQVFLYQAVVAAAYAAWRFRESPSVRRALVSAAGGVAAFVALTAAMWGPATAYLGESVRAMGLAKSAADDYSNVPAEAWTILVPDVVPGHAAGTVGFGYAGLLPWLALPVLLGRSVLRWVLAAASVYVVLALSWGPASALWHFAFDHVPLFSKFRNPSRLLYVVAAVAALSLAASLPRLAAFLGTPAGRRAAFAGLGVGALAAAWTLLPGSGLGPLPSLRLRIAAGILALAAAAAFLSTERVRLGALGALAAADMAVFAVPYLSRAERLAPLSSEWRHPILVDAASKLRAEVAGRAPERAFVRPKTFGFQNLALSVRLGNLSGYHPLCNLRALQTFFAATRPEVDLSGAAPEAVMFPLGNDLPPGLARLFHVQAFVDGPAARTELLRPDVPWAQVHHDLVPSRGMREDLALVLDPAFALGRTLVVPPDLAAGSRPDAASQPVEYLGGRDGERRWRVSAAEDGVLRTADVFHDGWRATIDGAPAEPVPVDHVLLGLPVPAGTHEVVFEYEPRGLRPLLALWAAAWAAAAAAAASSAVAGLRRLRTGA